MTTTAPDQDDGGYTVREARRRDLLSIHRIEKAAFPQPWPYSAFERYLEEPGFLVADAAGPGAGVDGDVVGYAVADTIPNHGTPLGHVKDIAVRAGARNHGIGSTLLARALGVLEGTGAATAKLEVRETNKDAIRLYRRFGFEQRRRVPGYYGNGEDALVMVTPLG